jgi:hypothetical protein
VGPVRVSWHDRNCRWDSSADHCRLPRRLIAYVENALMTRVIAGCFGFLTLIQFGEVAANGRTKAVLSNSNW